MNAAGPLRHRANFRSPVETSDGQGGLTVTYPAVTVSLACATASVHGVEQLGPGAGIVSTEVQMLTVRRHSAVSVKQRADVTFADSGLTVNYMVQRVERADDVGDMLAVYCTAVES